MNHERSLVQRVAEELRTELDRQERSRRWLARKTGLAQATVSRYIRGASAPDMNELDAMCRALGMSIPDLFARIDRNGGYDPQPVGDELLCAIRDLNPEPADSGLTWWREVCLGRLGRRAQGLSSVNPSRLTISRRKFPGPMACVGPITRSRTSLYGELTASEPLERAARAVA